MPPSPSQNPVLRPLSLLLSLLVHRVWPALAVLGGLDSGFCLGRACRVEGGEGAVAEGRGLEAVVVSVPDSERKVMVEERVTAHTLQKVQRSVHRACSRLFKDHIPSDFFSDDFFPLYFVSGWCPCLTLV